MADHLPALTMLSQELQRRTARRSVAEGLISTGCRGLDDLLSESGLKAGGLVEWLSERAEGSLTLALLAAVQALRSRTSSILAIVDPERQFYPPAVSAWGIPLERVVLIHPETSSDSLWAWEQVLRCPAVAACLGWLPETPSIALRRLQVAAERGGNYGLLVRPVRVLKQPSWADVRWRVTAESVPKIRYGPIRGRRLRVELLRCRNQMSGGVAVVEFPPHASHPLSVAPALADSTTAFRSTGS